MANEVMTVMDSRGYAIHVLEGVCAKTQDKALHEIYDDVQTVIERPALLIEVANRKELYYFRSVGWHLTLLLTVRYQNDQWEAVDCTSNPTTEQLSELLKMGKQVL